MRLVFFLILFYFFSFTVYAGCDDQPSNEVDWTNCNFIENLDLSGAGLAKSEMSGVNLSLANLEKSQINNSNLSFGNFIFTNFSNSNLFSSNLQYANCNMLALVQSTSAKCFKTRSSSTAACIPHHVSPVNFVRFSVASVREK